MSQRLDQALDALKARLKSSAVGAGDDGRGDQPAIPTKTRRRKRRPDFVAMVKRALAAGLDVRLVSYTESGVSMTLGEAPSSADPAVIETADDLRRLI